MKKIYLLSLILLSGYISVSCSDEDENQEYIPIAPVSPVVLDVTAVPYSKLSDYHFFDGALKNLTPAYKVIPYKPSSDLFSDYAHKSRFVWMPSGVKATWNGADNALNFPIGAVLIKTFYYNDVKNYKNIAQPNNTTKILETRLMIKQRNGTSSDSGWETYDYIWNDEQTEAFLDTAGEGYFIPITWTEVGIDKTIDYKIPAFSECITCHKLNPNQTSGGELIVPIGVKPQNLNSNYSYNGSQQNQLQKWIAEGYLENNLPSDISATVDWTDASKSLELRARSYIDINCAHCHRLGGHCDYVEMRFNFSNTDLESFGVCMTPMQSIPDKPYVINAGDSEHSEMPHRISSTDQSVMMPIIGRTIVHVEGLALINEWIDSLNNTCP